MSWKLVASDIPTQIGSYRVESQRDGNKTARLVTFPDDRQIRVLPDADHSGQYRIRVIKVALDTLSALDADSGSLPPSYDPMIYLYGALCFNNLEWEQVWTEPNLVDWLTDWFAPPTFEVSVLTLLRDLKSAGWVIRWEDEV